MVEWDITIIQGSDIIMQLKKLLPKGVLPPHYVNDINCASFLPLVGEFERVVWSDNLAIYEKLDNFFGG